MRNVFAHGLLVVGSLTLWLFLAAAPVIAATMPAVAMRVVDEHDGTPLPGLVAMFWGTAREGTFTGHGGKHAILVEVVPTLAEASRWEYEGTTVKMKKATDEPMRQQAYLTTTYTHTMVGFDLGCTWKRVPRTLVMADRMFPNPGMTNTLRTLFMNDALFAQRGCGSPKAFFEPYLRP